MGELPARFGKAGLIGTFPQAASRSLIQRWTPPLDQLVDWRWHKRTITLHFAHGIRREADHDEALLIAHLCEEAARFFTPEAGYGTITRINYMDGVDFFISTPGTLPTFVLPAMPLNCVSMPSPIANNEPSRW